MSAIEPGPIVLIGLCIAGVIFRASRVQMLFALLWLLLALGAVFMSFGTEFIRAAGVS